MGEAIRIGVTGSGFMGRTHADAAHRLEDTQLVAIAGGSRAAQLAADYGAQYEESIEALIRRSDIDAIVISTPHHCHVDEALLAAETGKHALVEKPMATSVEDCDRMATAFAEANLTLSLGYHQRFRDSNKTVRRLFAEAAIGQVRCMQTTALFDIEVMREDSGFGGSWNWWKDPRSKAHLINSAPHTVDLCRWWMGAEIASIAAHCGTFRETDNPNENTTMSLWHFDNGLMGTFWSSSVTPSPGFPGEDFRFRFQGDEGILDVNPFDEIKICRNATWETVYKQPPVGFDDSNAAFSMSRMQAYCDQMQGFVNSIHGESGGEGTPADGRAGVQAVIAMLDSSQRGETVSLR